MTRAFLDKLYLFSGYIATAFMIGIGVCILSQILWRMGGRTFDATEAAGFCLAASTFFGLAHTLRARGHVRIDLFTSKLGDGPRHLLEIVNCLLGTLVSGYLAWQVTLLALQSYSFHDISPGLLAMPMWIPQAGAAFGIVTLTIALLDELVWLLGGGESRVSAQAEVELDRPGA